MRMEEASTAGVDRLLAERRIDPGEPRQARASELAGESRWVLLGEPGSGKSATLLQAAKAAGTSVVTARAFVEGERPPGRTVFIDAFEEYRMGEAARERLADLRAALQGSTYGCWRIACRSVTLPPSEVRFLAEKLPPFRVWQLEPLDGREIRTILAHANEGDPNAFVRRIDRMAAGSLLGNPATLWLC